MKKSLIEQLEALILNGDIPNDIVRVREVRKTYEDLLEKELEAKKLIFIEEGGEPKDFEFRKTEEDLRIEELIQKFQSVKKEYDKKIAAQQAQNLIIKKGIVEKIKSLANIQSQPGKALKELKELQQQWRDIDSVSNHVYKDLQNEYSKAMESFYYSLDIYRMLKDHDFKKNLELKTAIIEKLKALLDNKKIKEIERMIKVYRNEWEEIGPVQNDKWEALKSEWRGALDALYAKLKTYYKELEEKKEKSLAAKLDYIEQAKAMIDPMPDTEEKWRSVSAVLIKMQRTWVHLGKSDKVKGEQAMKEFRSLCDKFFDARATFFVGIKVARSDSRQKKMALIKEAEELMTSTNWKATTDRLIRMQLDWKKIPPVGPQEEPRLFHRFRKACNTFFDARKKHSEDQEASLAAEVKVKEEQLAKFCAMEISGDEAKDKETLKLAVEEWQGGGNIPPKDKKRLNDAFYKQVDAFCSKLNIHEHELELMRFKNKLERLEKDDDAEMLLQREYDHFRKQAEEIHLGILKYENNLGFFKSSKGDNPLMKDILDKIQAEKERLQAVKQKQKMVGEVLRKVQV